MTTTPNKTNNSANKRGNNRQPARQAYKVYRPSKTVKRWTETLKGYLKVQKLSPEQRGAVAFFTIQPEKNGATA